MDIRCKNCFKVHDDEYARCPYCGYSEGEPPKELYHLYPGTELLGRYVIGEVLGFGGFGITYKAWDKKFETVLAIKEYYPSGIVNRNPGESEVILFTGKKKDIFENGLVRFLDEAKNMAKFSQNNNIVNVFEYFEDNNTGYIVMEFLEGISLNSYLLKQTQKLPLEEIMNITMSVCAALKELHAIGIIHRDVSPDNIFMCSNGKIKLIDFGAARFSLNEEKKMTIILKPGFAPPEQYEKINKQGPWTDIYALGATVYLLLTGTKPDESTNRKVEDKVVSPSKLDSSIPEYVSNTIMKSIALDKKNRFASIDKFEKALLKKTKVAKVNNGNNTSKSKKSGVSSIIIGALLIVALVFGIVTFINNKKENLKKTSLTLWYTYDSNDMESKTNQIKDMIKSFNKDYPQVTINAKGFDETTYVNELNTGLNSSTGPNIFDSSYASSDMLKNTISTDELLKKINRNEYVLLNVVAHNTQYKNRIPMAFNIPVMYVNTSELGHAYDTKSILKLSDVDSKENLANHIGIHKKYEDFYKQNYSNNEAYVNEYVVDKALDSFITEELYYYISSTKEYRYIQEKLPGKYTLLYLKTSNTNIEYDDFYSINTNNLSSNQKKAALVFFRYMLSIEGQDNMYMSHNTAIPINIKVYNEWCLVNKELKSVITEVNELKNVK